MALARPLSAYSTAMAAVAGKHAGNIIYHKQYKFLKCY